jgi:transcriptional regulator with XRE-family HTH domain
LLAVAHEQLTIHIHTLHIKCMVKGRIVSCHMVGEVVYYRAWHTGDYTATRKNVHVVTRSLDMKLRVLRAERQLSLREASEKTGVDKVSLSKYERGLGYPQDRTLAKIAKGYGVPVEDLLEEEPTTGPLGEPPSASPSPETAGAGQWERIRELSPRAKQGIHDFIAARGHKIPLKSPRGREIMAGLVLAIEELDENNPELHLLDRLEVYSALHEFTQEAPPEVVADVLLGESAEEDDMLVTVSLVELVQRGRLTLEQLARGLVGAGQALSPST